MTSTQYTESVLPEPSGDVFERSLNLGLTGWRARVLAIALDINLAVMIVLALFGLQIVVVFHTAFAILTMMVFMHGLRAYLFRAAVGLSLITMAVAIGVRREVANVEELYEIPIMIGMVASVLWAVVHIRRLINELNSQQRLLRQLHMTSQIEMKEQLFMSQRLATQGRLSAGIAHNFRNTMTAILSLAERIEQTTIDETVEHAAVRIQAQTNGAAELITGMLNLSTARQDSDSTDLGEALHDDRAILELLAGADVQIEFDVDDGPLIVPLARPRVTHLLLNVIMNAHDAMSNGGEISVSAKRTAGFVELRVTDSGHGMDVETIARAFEPFFTTKSAGDGSGLGLFMVRTYVEDAGGSVRVLSQVGSGTSIEISLPEVAGDVAVRAPRSLDIRPERFFGTETIVVAEDDPIVREQLIWTLQMFGYNVHEAADGEAALAVLADRPDVALVISDVVMPRCSGPELERRLRAQGRDVPFLFTSAYEPSSSAYKKLPRDATVLAKPFGRTALLSQVRETLN